MGRDRKVDARFILPGSDEIWDALPATNSIRVGFGRVVIIQQGDLTAILISIQDCDRGRSLFHDVLFAFQEALMFLTNPVHIVMFLQQPIVF